jgi:hypothetical protein
MIESERKQVKGHTLLIWYSVIVSLIFVYVLFSKGTDEATRKNTFWLALVIIVGIIIYFLLNRKVVFDPYEVGKKYQEYYAKYYGQHIDLKEMTCDMIDPTTVVFNFGNVRDSLKYRLKGTETLEGATVGILSKGLDDVKLEIAKNDILRQMAQKEIRSKEERRVAEEAGFEMVESEKI